ncbi:MAG: hypothetical protein FJZ95_04220 [Chloroflexi bacterium]|nr:hypothetical protein [Chloroflexota bacterium]
MIEVTLTYDFLHGMDRKAYDEWAKKAIVALLKSSGIVEFRANRNLMGSPQVRLVAVWGHLSDWARFAESAEWPGIFDELRAKFATNVTMQIWGPSPVAPEPLRPPKSA